MARNWTESPEHTVVSGKQKTMSALALYYAHFEQFVASETSNCSTKLSSSFFFSPFHVHLKFIKF